MGSNPTCCHLNFIYGICFEHGVPCIQANYPENIPFDKDVFKTSWSYLSSSSSLRHLDQDKYVDLSLRLQDICIFVLKTNRFVAIIPLQDVVKTFSRRLQDVFKMSCRDDFNKFSRRRQDLSKRIIKLNCSCWHVFGKYSTRFWDVLFEIRLSTEEFAQLTLLLRNLRSLLKIFQRDENFSNSSFSLYYTFKLLLKKTY